jgi:hypothetical protein
MSLPRFAFKVVCQVEIARMAAALSYRTIFGLIPALVLGLVVLGAFSSDGDVADLMHRLLRFTGISQIALEGSSSEAAYLMAEAAWRDWARWFFAEIARPEGPGQMAWVSTADDRPGSMASALAGGAAGRVDVWIAELVQNVRRIPLGTIGFVGLATLIYAAISMMVEIEKCFNQIYHAPEGRPWIRRVTQYWTLLTLGSLLLFASFYVGESLRSLASRLGELDHVVSGLGSGAVPLRILTNREQPPCLLRGGCQPESERVRERRPQWGENNRWGCRRTPRCDPRTESAAGGAGSAETPATAGLSALRARASSGADP